MMTFFREEKQMGEKARLKEQRMSAMERVRTADVHAATVCAFDSVCGFLP